jgi:hypothetical protein
LLQAGIQRLHGIEHPVVYPNSAANSMSLKTR